MRTQVRRINGIARLTSGLTIAEYYVKLKGPDVKFEAFEDFVKKNGKSVDTYNAYHLHQRGLKSWGI
jgi:hypothetical protein